MTLKIRFWVWVGVLAAAVAAQGAPREVRYTTTEGVLGTTLRVGVAAVSEAAAAASETEVRKEISRLDAVFSGWSNDSEFARLVSAGRASSVSPELFEVLVAAEGFRGATGGAFNPAVGGLGDLWKAAAAAGKEPDPATLKAEVERMAKPPYTLDGATRGVVIAPGVRVSLDAIAKGYIVDRAAAVVSASTADATPVLVSIGGDMVVRGDTPILVDVRDPRFPSDNEAPLCRLKFTGRALASSGGYARGYDVGGKHRSHIFDPKTGKPVEHILGASVLAPTAMVADALATALNVLPVDAGMELVRKTEGADAVVVTADGNVRVTDGFRKLAEPGAWFGPRKPPAGWPSGYSLTVDFEIQDTASAGASGGGRRRGSWKRPYVAVFVEDAKGQPVKTLCLWYKDRRWLTDLKRWVRLYRDRRDDMAEAVSSATRKAGTYSLTWDGRNDADKPVPEGDYTLCIEVVREHGTYQIARDAMKIGASPFSHEVAGNAEMKKASVRYGKKS